MIGICSNMTDLNLFFDFSMDVIAMKTNLTRKISIFWRINPLYRTAIRKRISLSQFRFQNIK